MNNSNRKCGRHGMICWVLAMEMLQGVWKQRLRPRAVVGYGVKIFLPSPPNYVTRSPGGARSLTTANVRSNFPRLWKEENGESSASVLTFQDIFSLTRQRITFRQESRRVKIYDHL